MAPVHQWSAAQVRNWTFSLDRIGTRLDAMNLGVLLALSSALAYGAADFLGGVGSRRHSSWRVVLIGQAAGALVMLAAALLLPGSPAGVMSSRTGLARSRQAFANYKRKEHAC